MSKRPEESSSEIVTVSADSHAPLGYRDVADSQQITVTPNQGLSLYGPPFGILLDTLFDHPYTMRGMIRAWRKKQSPIKQLIVDNVVGMILGTVGAKLFGLQLALWKLFLLYFVIDVLRQLRPLGRSFVQAEKFWKGKRETAIERMEPLWITQWLQEWVAGIYFLSVWEEQRSYWLRDHKNRQGFPQSDIGWMALEMDREDSETAAWQIWQLCQAMKRSARRLIEDLADWESQVREPHRELSARNSEQGITTRVLELYSLRKECEQIYESACVLHDTEMRRVWWQERIKQFLIKVGPFIYKYRN